MYVAPPSTAMPITLGGSNIRWSTCWSLRPPDMYGTAISTSVTWPQLLQQRWHCKVSLAMNSPSESSTLPELTVLLQKMDMASLDSAFSSFVGQTDLTSFARVVCKLHKAGLPTAKYVGPSTTGILAQQLQELHKQDVRICVHILVTLSQCGFAVKDLVTPLHVLQSCAKTGEVNLMLRYTRVLPRNVRMFNDVITGLAQQGDLGAAKFVLSFLPDAGYYPDMYIYRTLVDACALCGQPAAAYSIFQDMLEAGLTPNVFVCNSLLHANAKDLNLVRRIYRQMQDCGARADAPTYHILLKAFCAAGRYDLVFDLYREVQSYVACGTVHLDNLTYSRFVQAFGDAKMWESAIRVKDDMMDAGVFPNAVTWNCLIGVFATCGLGGQALRMFHAMIQGGYDPNTGSYNMVLHAFAEGGQQEKAFQLFVEWKRDGLFSSILREDFGTADLSLEVAQHGGDGYHAPLHQITSESLRSWSEGAKSCKPDLVTYNTMMKACKQTPHDAELLMQEMQWVGIRPDQKSWSILLDIYGGAGDLEGATRVFWDMKQAGILHDAVSFTSMIKACVVARSPDTAFYFFDQMKAAGIQPNIVTYNTLLRAQRKCGQLSEVQRALALYTEMREAGFAPKDRILKGLLEEWAEGALQRRNYVKRGPGFVQEGSTYLETDGLDKFTELLLQNVAAHVNTAQDGETMVIDLRGLSKDESRLAVLAVLRILKERHADESLVIQDLEIITGARRQSRSVIQDAILGVLQDELGLTVLFADSQTTYIGGQDACRLEGQTAWSISDSYPSTPKVIEDSTVKLTVTNGSSLKPIRPDESTHELGLQVKQRNPSPQLKIVARRPLNSGRLRVSKDTLSAWLRKGVYTKLDRRGNSGLPQRSEPHSLEEAVGEFRR